MQGDQVGAQGNIRGAAGTNGSYGETKGTVLAGARRPQTHVCHPTACSSLSGRLFRLSRAFGE